MKMHVLSNQFFLNTIGNCKIWATCNFLANIFVRTVLTDLLHQGSCLTFSLAGQLGQPK